MNESGEKFVGSVSEHGSIQPLPHVPVIVSVSCCLALSVIYVGSLYVWNSKHNRDHPSTVKRRFCSVFVVMLFAPLFVYKFSSPELLERVPLYELLGLRRQGFLPATILPLLLTVILYLGPLCVQMENETMKLFLKDFNFWKHSVTNILCIRNLIVAPLSEEFVFRACMMPLILQSFSPMMAVFITPLFFGVAHVHHIAERLSLGMDWKSAIAVSCFQLTFTTIFGCYEAFLFARTGHFIAPFLVHAFCNHMGLPDLQDLWQHHVVRRVILIALYLIGLLGWIFLLPIATQPHLYANNLFWPN